MVVSFTSNAFRKQFLKMAIKLIVATILMCGINLGYSSQIIIDSVKTSHTLILDSNNVYFTPKGWVNDFENLFTENEKQYLNSLISSFERKTTIEISIVTIDTSACAPNNFNNFTLELARSWGVGKKETLNGILIGVSKGFRKIRINNAIGIQELISDEETKEIIERDIIPEFKNNNYYQGVLNGIVKLIETLDFHIDNISLIKPDTNILYANFPNELSISGLKNYSIISSSENILMQNSELNEDDEVNFTKQYDVVSANAEKKAIITIIPQRKNTNDTLYIKKNEKIIFQKTFQIIDIGKMVNYFVSGISESQITKSELLQTPKLSFEAENSLLIYHSQFVSYVMTIEKRHSNLIQDFKIYGAQYSKPAIEAIQELKTGDIIYFENVKIKGPDNNIRTIESKKITLL